MPAAAPHRSRKRPWRSQRETPPLPLDLVLEIAARSDPATLVRCAATCKDARRRVADPGFHRSLRLRHAVRFVPSLLHGHLVWKSPTHLYLVDNTWMPSTKLLLSTAGWCSRPDGKKQPLTTSHNVQAARDGLLLISTADEKGKELVLRVCNPATGSSQIVPHQKYNGQYVLLGCNNENNSGGGGGAIGRSFRVLKVTTKLAGTADHRRVLQSQTFFSEHGRWAGCSRSVNIPIPFVHGGWFRQQPLVIDGALHWLCRSDKLFYIVKLQADSAQVTTTELPVRFHREYGRFAAARKQLLLAKTSAGSGALCVFAAEKEKISVWVQSEHDSRSSRWTKQPQMEIKYEDVMCCEKEGRRPRERTWTVRLEWFSDRSGSVLMEAPGHGFYMLDVRSKRVFGWYPRRPWKAWEISCPYEMDVSSWVPTFSNKTF